jgi:predicted Rossmann fold flavoprotein
MNLPAYDVLVAGGGAAGLWAAATAASRGLRTALLEKNERPGLKILISGGGRCNVTTTRQGSDLEGQYGQRRGRFLRHALHVLPPTAVALRFGQLGVPLREEDLEKLFPVSQRARDVLDALLRQAEQAGVEVRLRSGLLDLVRTEDGFVAKTAQGELAARSVILATGGLSYPKTGATGDGYRFARALGHEVTRTMPALAPLLVEEPWVRSLQGIVLYDVELAVVDEQGRVVHARRRPILFTHKGLSGPGPMDLSGFVEERPGLPLRFDFAPDVERSQLEAEWLALARSHGKRRVETCLPPNLPERLRAALCAMAGCEGMTLANLGKQQRQDLLRCVKDLRTPVVSSLGFGHAEVTRGGVALAEVDPKTMQSRLVPGLFFCGEVLDLDGPIGGFNFQAAFATAEVAGRSCLRT